MKADTKKAETELLQEIERLGLVRDVVHEKFQWPMTFDGDTHGTVKPKNMVLHGKERTINNPRLYLGITWVRLYTRKTWDKMVKESKKTGLPKQLGGFVAEGRANCSELEGHYSKKKGRLIATARALKEFKNRPEEKAREAGCANA